VLSAAPTRDGTPVSAKEVVNKAGPELNTRARTPRSASKRVVLLTEGLR
jgi:hypothetical protein